MGIRKQNDDKTVVVAISSPSWLKNKHTFKIFLLGGLVFSGVAAYVAANWWQSRTSTTPDSAVVASDSNYYQDQKVAYINEIDNLKAPEGGNGSTVLWTQFMVYYQQGEHQKAIDKGVELMRLPEYSNNVILYEQLADSYKAIGSRDGEVEAINKIIELASEDPETISPDRLEEYRSRL